jgi:hypothetical protein
MLAAVYRGCEAIHGLRSLLPRRWQSARFAMPGTPGFPPGEGTAPNEDPAPCIAAAKPSMAAVYRDCGMLVCLLMLLSTGQTPNKAMFQVAFFFIFGLASLKELEAFVVSRKEEHPGTTE